MTSLNPPRVSGEGFLTLYFRVVVARGCCAVDLVVGDVRAVVIDGVGRGGGLRA